MVGIVVVNYNSEEEVLKLATSLRELSIKDFKLLVVDNKSPDGSGQRLKDNLRSAEVLLADSNLGFAAGVNLGIEHFLLSNNETKYFWILNPDMTVEPEALKALIEKAEQTNGIVGSKVLVGTAEHQKKIWSAGGFVDLVAQTTTMRGNSEVDSGQFEESINCDYVPGCSLFASVELIKKIGLFSEKYFLYFEETDWCMKAKRLGIPVVYQPKSVVNHFFREEKLSEPTVTYYYNRNRRLFFFLYGNLLSRLKLIFKTLFVDYLEAKRSLTESPDERYHQLFKAHVDSCRDFLLCSFGPRRS
jgi:GT2 family glycosyltransferase